MTHLSEETLNEYLDNALAAPARVAADVHLAACTACMAELETLRGLFVEIESLPEVALERNISAAVVARLGQRAGVPRVIRWALAGQALVVAVILMLAWPLFNFSAFELPIVPDFPSLAQLISIWAAQQDAWVRALGRMNLLPSFSLPFDPSAALLTLTLVSACLLWLVGNGLLLLLPRTTSLKRRNS